MENRRLHPRVPMSVDIKIVHKTMGEKLLKTKNVSDSGLFILIEPVAMPVIGEIVKGQVQGMPVEAPEVAMEVVRTENDGMGLRYLLDEE